MGEIKPKTHAERLEKGALKREAIMLEAMVRDYCRRHHGQKELCKECEQFLIYALTRLACCPFGENKPTCQKCRIHCYRPEQKEIARQIMREEGPRMLFKHPLLTAEHLVKNLKKAPEKPRNPNARKSVKASLQRERN